MKLLKNQKHNHKCCEIKFIPINIRMRMINGEYIMTSKKGVKKKWIPKRMFKHLLKRYEGREIVIKVDIQDLGEINEVE